MGARDTALEALIACRKDGAWSNGILKQYTARDNLDRRDSALASRLCYGVLQNRGLLDFYLRQLLTGKLKNLHPALRDILHLGLYQILFLDKIPASAAVNEAVKQARKTCKFPGAAGLVNGVLRSAIRQKDTLKKPVSDADQYSHPEKLISLLRENVGEENLKILLEADNAIPPVVIQVNTLRVSAEELKKTLESGGVSAEYHPWMPDCLVLTSTGNVEKLPGFSQGYFYVQDAASKLSVLCARIPRGASVLDCCAAPGGKSFAAAILMGDSGHICACDLHSHKVALMENGARRLQLTSLSCHEQDATREHPGWQGTFDAVIADVPCSGYGIIRKKPDIRYKDPDSMRELPDLQKKILERQSAYVKPGGVLLYSTCTLLRRENEEVVAWFLENHPDFTPEPLPLPEGLPGGESGMLTLIPGKYDTDGFFICRMRRRP